MHWLIIIYSLFICNIYIYIYIYNYSRPTQSTGSPRKPGIVAKEKGAILQFDILDLSIPVKVLTIQYLRSYGEAWEGSEVLITVRRKRQLTYWTETATKQLFGIHDSKTSITYESEIRFPDEIEIGSDAQAEIQLTGGTTFWSCVAPDCWETERKQNGLHPYDAIYCPNRLGHRCPSLARLVITHSLEIWPHPWACIL